MPLEIEPLQKPHPPLWYGAHSPDSAERAARKGLHMVTNDMPGPTRAIVARYREVWREAQGDARRCPRWAWCVSSSWRTRDDEALTIARRAYLRWRHSFTYLHDMHGTRSARRCARTVSTHW